ncbi:heme biosynthesis HemY N-terminal domain-containing protein [Luminiphilus syltensis]|uniref:heme biosynthesis HemY N-terminal domain-containing protein n=1 Tax=Luminiphilus syltensis TaxID=1341119 RepID=UPI0002E8251F|nr:heme biosynthesis HemY N-terminal domain-containing protein [Luminiphilus syltensis]
MRRLIFLLIVGLLAGAGLIALVEQDPGEVVISYGSTTIETSIWVGGFLWLLFWGILVLAYRLLMTTLRAPRSVSGWLGHRKSRTAQALTNRGLINFIEGNWKRSRRQLLRSARYSDAPLVNYLLAARASFRLGDQEGMQAYLRDAESVEGDTAIAMELTQAELQLSAGHYEQALATLVRARQNASRHPSVLELLATAYSRLEDWESLSELLPELRRHKVLDEHEIERLEHQTWDALLVQCCGEGDDSAVVDRIWQRIPGSVKTANPGLQRRYVDCLVKMDAHDKAQRLIVDALERNWDAHLVASLSRLSVNRPDKVLKKTERWLETHGRDPVLLLCAGRMALQAKDWNKAQEYLQESHHLAANAEICMELARFHQASGDPKRAMEFMREAALTGAGDLPELPLPDSALPAATPRQIDTQ